MGAKLGLSREEYGTLETAICCNSRIDSFTGDKKNLDRLSVDQHWRMLCFYVIISASCLLWTYHF